MRTARKEGAGMLAAWEDGLGAPGRSREVAHRVEMVWWEGMADEMMARALARVCGRARTGVVGDLRARRVADDSGVRELAAVVRRARAERERAEGEAEHLGYGDAAL